MKILPLSERGIGVESARSTTTATVVRAGEWTTLVSLERWHHGHVLVPVETRVITAVTGRSRHDLPGTRLQVTACLDSLLDGGLALQGWSIIEPQ